MLCGGDVHHVPPPVQPNLGTVSVVRRATNMLLAIYRLICILYSFYVYVIRKLDCNINMVYSSSEDNSKRLLELEEMLDHEESLTSRVLLREGALEKLNRDKYSSFHFILTTDAIIYCTPNILGEKMKLNRILPLSALLVM